jgi:hypothetical protein
MPRWFVLAALLLMASPAMFSQVAPDATDGRLQQWSVGAGLSDYNPDLGRGRMLGGTLWVDYTLNFVPKTLRGIGIELESRDISLNRSPLTLMLREDTAGLGGTYTWPHSRNFRPYMKVIAGLGNADYLVGVAQTQRYHQSRTVINMGGGFEVKVYQRLWTRVDYEYQAFTDFFVGNSAQHSNGAPLDPQGFTLGVIYHVGHVHSSQ